MSLRDRSWLHLVRHWRTQAGAAELQRERDRIRGASEALDLTLRAWDAGVAANARGGAGVVTMTDPTVLRRKRTEVYTSLRCIHTVNAEGIMYYHCGFGLVFFSRC